MAIEVFCNCGNSISVGAELAGRKVRCKSCDEVLRIPEVPMDFSDDGETGPPSGEYEVLEGDAQARTCDTCGAAAGPHDTACLACGAELTGGGPGALAKVPRPVLLGAVGVVLLLILGGVAKAVYTATRPGAHTAEGMALLAAEDYQGAEREFKEALGYDNAYPGARVGLAQVGAGARESRLIRLYVPGVLEDGLVPDPQEAGRLRLALAWVLLEEKRYVRAKSEAQEAIQDDSSLEGEAMAVVGLAAREEGSGEEARDALRAALRNRYEDPRALRELALILREEGEIGEAREVAERAVKHADDAPAWLLVAELRSLDGDADAAAAALERALAQDPSNAVAHGRLSTIQLARGELDAALASARKAGELAPADPLVQTALGRVLLAKGQPAEAQEPLATAVKGGAGWEAEFLLGKAYLQAGDERQGLPMIQRALREQTDPALHLEAARLILEAGSAQKAVGILSDLLGAHPDDYDAQVCMAQALARMAHGRQRHDAEIRQHLDEALKIAPARREAPLELGLHLFERLQPDDAAQVFQAGLKANPRDKELLYYFGWACIRARRWDEAIKSYEDLIRLDAAYKDAKAKLDEAHEGKFYDQKR